MIWKEVCNSQRNAETDSPFLPVMSYRFLFLKHGLVSENAPGCNAVGRFIPQLQRITIKFCKEKGSSSGVR